MESIDLNLGFEGEVPGVVHVHLTQPVDLDAIHARFDTLETSMSDLNAATSALTAAVGDASARIDEDVAHLRDLLNEALATDSADAARIAELEADASQTVDRLTDATTALNAIDPDLSFPAAPPDENPDETPVDEPPADEPTGEPA